MSYIFETKDSSGRIIHLSHERWSHIQKHKEEAGTIAQICDTLLKPTTIIEMHHDKTMKSYYRYYKERRRYLFVLVKYLNGKGFILTSYFTNKM